MKKVKQAAVGDRAYKVRPSSLPNDTGSKTLIIAWDLKIHDIWGFCSHTISYA